MQQKVEKIDRITQDTKVLPEPNLFAVNHPSPQNKECVWLLGRAHTTD